MTGMRISYALSLVFGCAFSAAVWAGDPPLSNATAPGEPTPTTPVQNGQAGGCRAYAGTIAKGQRISKNISTYKKSHPSWRLDDPK